MVNTFLVDSDFIKSAKVLDSKRLNKQTSEGLIIYRNIINLKLLSKYYNIPYPLDDYKVKEWIRLIVKKYKSENVIFLFRNGELSQLIKVDKNTKLIRQSYNQQIINLDGDVVTLKDNKNKLVRVPKNNLVTLSDNLIKLGYMYHPAILMWFNYESALKYYISVHIEECKRRGMTNNITLDKLDQDYKVPEWTKDQDFLNRHKSNLIRKDHKYYSNIFIGISNDLEYLWPFN